MNKIMRKFTLISIFVVLYLFSFGQCTNQEKNDTILYYDVDKLPLFNYNKMNLSEYLYSNIILTEEMLETQGKVIVSFVIDTKGKVSNVKIEKSLTPACDKEILRLFNEMPMWIPAQKDNKEINVIMFYPIYFIIKG
jgi:protein TonB